MSQMRIIIPNSQLTAFNALNSAHVQSVVGEQHDRHYGTCTVLLLKEASKLAPETAELDYRYGPPFVPPPVLK